MAKTPRRCGKKDAREELKSLEVGSIVLWRPRSREFQELVENSVKCTRKVQECIKINPQSVY